MRKYILDENKNVVLEPDTVKWALWFEKADRVVKQTRPTSKVLVSTVFLGIDHGWNEDKPPVVFETMIFGGPLSDEQYRCYTWDQARVIHDYALSRVRRALWQRLRKRRRG